MFTYIMCVNEPSGETGSTAHTPAGSLNVKIPTNVKPPTCVKRIGHISLPQCRKVVSDNFMKMS